MYPSAPETPETSNLQIGVAKGRTVEKAYSAKIGHANSGSNKHPLAPQLPGGAQLWPKQRQGVKGVTHTHHPQRQIQPMG